MRGRHAGGNERGDAEIGTMRQAGEKAGRDQKAKTTGNGAGKVTKCKQAHQGQQDVVP
jgi:hypothetical protein